MYNIICKELTPRLGSFDTAQDGSGQAGEVCDFESVGKTKEEVKNNFYKHGEESPLHKEAYESATDDEAEDFGKKLDEYLTKQE